MALKVNCVILGIANSSLAVKLDYISLDIDDSALFGSLA